MPSYLHRCPQLIGLIAPADRLAAIEVVDKNGRGSVHHAALRGRLAVLRVLLGLGADANGTTPTHTFPSIQNPRNPIRQPDALLPTTVPPLPPPPLPSLPACLPLSRAFKKTLIQNNIIPLSHIARLRNKSCVLFRCSVFTSPFLVYAETRVWFCFNNTFLSQDFVRLFYVFLFFLFLAPPHPFPSLPHAHT